MKCMSCGSCWSTSMSASQARITKCPFCGAGLTKAQPDEANIVDVITEIVTLMGENVLYDVNRTTAVFQDLAPKKKKESYLLKVFLMCDGAKLLQTLEQSVNEQNARKDQVVKRMMDDYSLSEERAEWICSNFWSAISGQQVIPKAVVEASTSPTEHSVYKTDLTAVRTNCSDSNNDANDTAKAEKWWTAYYNATITYKIFPVGDHGNILFGRDFNGGLKKGERFIDAYQYYGLVAYYGCWGEPINKEKAANEFARGAERGEASSQYNLGVCYDRGDGVAQNRNEAEQWFSKAAKKGLPEAKCCLGVYCLCNYSLTSGSHTEAVKWFREAAAQGLSDAEFYLGMCFLNGNGVPANCDEAKTWLSKASNSGSTLAKSFFFFHPELS